MKSIKYPAKINYQKEDKSYLVEFPDLKGCLTEGETLEEALINGKEALSGYLASIFYRNFTIPKPSKLKGKNVHVIEPDLEVSVPIMLRQLRTKLKLNQKEIAGKLKISYQAYQRFENPNKCNITLKTLTRISNIFKHPVHITFD